MAVKKLQAILMEQQDHRVFAAHSSLGWSAGERDWFEITESFLECKNAVTALDSGFGKRLSSTEVEGTLKDWPTDEQASLGRADGSLEPLPSSYNSAICSRHFEPVVSAAPNSTYAGA